MIDTSNINSLIDIDNLQIRTPQVPGHLKSQEIFQCCACENWRYIDKMYSLDWCKACYKYCLKCKFQGIKFTPWKDRKDKYESFN